MYKILKNDSRYCGYSWDTLYYLWLLEINVFFFSFNPEPPAEPEGPYEIQYPGEAAWKRQ